MVAPFADIPREESTLAWSQYLSRIHRVTEKEGGLIELFSTSSSIYHLLIIKNKGQTGNKLQIVTFCDPHNYIVLIKEFKNETALTRVGTKSRV